MLVWYKCLLSCLTPWRFSYPDATIAPLWCNLSNQNPCLSHSHVCFSVNSIILDAELQLLPLLSGAGDMEFRFSYIGDFLYWHRIKAPSIRFLIQVSWCLRNWQCFCELWTSLLEIFITNLTITYLIDRLKILYHPN